MDDVLLSGGYFLIKVRWTFVMDIKQKVEESNLWSEVNLLLIYKVDTFV